MTNEEGNKIKRWALYGPPKMNTQLDWTTRRQALFKNMKAWRVIFQNFTAADGLYPNNLDPPITQKRGTSTVNLMAHHRANDKLEDCYNVVVGNFQLELWASEGIVYAGSDA